jgi:hypothetical protein
MTCTIDRVAVLGAALPKDSKSGARRRLAGYVRRTVPMIE